MANPKCKECGCVCSKCTLDHDVHLHLEIENLKQQLLEKHNHIVTMETNFLNEANKYPNGELLALHDELLMWQDKYKRIYEAHRRIQRVNQGLEDKLLRLVDVNETDKSTLTKDVATLSYKLAEANYTIKKLTEDNERYKNDVSVAIQFLQCKPGNFVSQKFDTLPNEVQAKVSNYMGGKRKPDEKKTPPEMKSIKVPIPTFPPTAMVYSVPKSQAAASLREEKDPEPPVDIVSAAIMAKVLEERARERSCIKHCDTCTCSNQLKIVHSTTHHSIGTQTSNICMGSLNQQLCLQCNNRSVERSSIQIVKGVSNLDVGKNKPMPVYIHDYESNTNASFNTNVAKVQPNNFLKDGGETCKLRKGVLVAPVTPIVPVMASPVSGTEIDLIDLGTPANQGSTGGEIIYFANERGHKKLHKIKTHDSVKVLLQTQSTNLKNPHNTQETHHIQFKVKSQHVMKPINCDSLLLQSCDDEFRQMFIPASNVTVAMPFPLVGHKTSSLSSGDPSELTSSEPSNSATKYQRVEEWMDSISLAGTATAGSHCGTDCSEMTSSLAVNCWESKKMIDTTRETRNEERENDIVGDIDTSKYKEMEDNVKKFLLGEYTLLSDVSKNDTD